MKDGMVLAMDGFNKVKPITEGRVVKGGVNTTSRILTRPPPPQPMRPATGAAATSESAKAQ